MLKFLGHSERKVRAIDIWNGDGVKWSSVVGDSSSCPIQLLELVPSHDRTANIPHRSCQKQSLWSDGKVKTLNLINESLVGLLTFEVVVTKSSSVVGVSSTEPVCQVVQDWVKAAVLAQKTEVRAYIFDKRFQTFKWNHTWDPKLNLHDVKTPKICQIKEWTWDVVWNWPKTMFESKLKFKVDILEFEQHQQVCTF